MSAKVHSERKHSKFSASGAERWFICQGSVALSEGLPDKSSIWSIEGTKAHEVLEEMLSFAIERERERLVNWTKYNFELPKEMILHGLNAANFLLELYHKTPQAEIMVETRIQLPFIHSEMFGTFDGAVIDHFGTLHVFDYKYGAGVPVSPVKNLQMIFYGLGLAYKFGWNFKSVRLWIIQPRIKAYSGPLYWDVSIDELKNFYVWQFKNAVERVEETPNRFVEGAHCHFCKAKGMCPLKQEAKLEKAKSVFSANPIKR